MFTHNKFIMKLGIGTYYFKGVERGLVGKMDLKIICVILVCLGQCISAQNTSPCSNGNWDWQVCRQTIIDVANDRARFWFGTDWINKCQNASLLDLECFSWLPSRNNSIASRLSIDPTTIDRYLNVTFTSKPGKYGACDHYYVQKYTKNFTLDPGSDATHEPWHTRSLPNMTWNYENSTLYTVILGDVGIDYIHAIYMNIPGNMVDKGDVIREYFGPGNPRNLTMPYAFMVFDQQGLNKLDLSVTQWANIAVLPSFSVSEFRDTLGMKGPIAMNWILSTFDPYSVQRMREFGFIENCSPFVEQALRSHDLQFISNIPKLSVFMSVQFENQPLGFEFCCKNHYYKGRTFNLDPIGNGTMEAAETRSENMITVRVNMTTLFPNPAANFSGKLYTMLAVDANVPVMHAVFGNRSYPYVHWMALNGQVDSMGVIEFGTTVKEWNSPLPPDNIPHTYYFILLEQNSGRVDITQDDAKAYSHGDFCSNSDYAGRCLFDVNRFSNNNNLQMVGASWMRVNNSDYVNMTNELDESVEVCGADNYPCVIPPWTGNANSVYVHLAASLCVILLGFIFPF